MAKARKFELASGLEIESGSGNVYKVSASRMPK